jgi:hypothetical protein
MNWTVTERGDQRGTVTHEHFGSEQSARRQFLSLVQCLQAYNGLRPWIVKLIRDDKVIAESYFPNLKFWRPALPDCPKILH